MASKVLKDKVEIAKVKKGKTVVKSDKSVLNDNQKQFCVEYIIDLNGTQAYLRTYGEDVDTVSANTMSSRLLSNVKIKKYINELIDSYMDNVDVTVGEIVNNIKSIAFNEEARHSDRIKASQLLAQYMGMLVEHKDITSNGSSINVTLED